MKYREINIFQRRINYFREFLRRPGRFRFAWYRFKWNCFPSLNIVPRFPLHVDIEISDACNLRCKMCVHGQDKTMNKGFIDKDFAKRWIKEAADEGVYSLKLNWRGEPALYKDLAGLVGYAKKCGIAEVQINTNGLPFTKKSIEDIVKAGLDRVIFSVDADSAQTYEKIRVGGDFNKLLENIDYFISVRHELGRKKPCIRVQMVRMKDNRHEVDSFLRKWQNKVDDVRVTDVTDRGQGGAMFVGTQVSTGRRRCPQPWLRMVINREGLVMPCCSDWYCQWVIGDARKNSLRSIWQGEKMRELRKLILENRLDEFEPCKSCFVKESYTWRRIDTKNGTN